MGGGPGTGTGGPSGLPEVAALGDGGEWDREPGRGEVWSLPDPGPVLKPSRRPRSLTSQSSGFLGNYRLFPNTPVGMRSGETALLCSFHGDADSEAEICEVLSLPHAAWVWR